VSQIARLRSVLAVLAGALCIGTLGTHSSRVAAQAEAAGAACDRACLDGMMDRYLAALIKHDPAQLPLARNVRFTENGVALRLGDGLWGTASALGKFKQFFEDVSQGQVGYFGTIRENGRPVILSARLRLARNGARDEVSEIETLVVRADNTDTENGPELLDAMGGASPLYAQSLAPGERRSRAQLIAIANSYFDGLTGGTAQHTPFSSQCNRWNNGELTTNAPHAGKILGMSCAEQFDSRFLVFVTRIRRRVPLVDVERGVVLASGFFDHAGRMRSVKLRDGTTMEVPVTHQHPKTLALMEAFKIVDGKIRRIDAVEGFVTYGLCSGWDGDHCPTPVSKP
jgi:hypothetical protein